jgi:hypothetical protein
MAFTVVKTPTVFGNKKVVILNVTTDGAGSNIETGLGYIEAVTVGQFYSMATGGAQIRKNVNSTGTAANGTLGLSGFSAAAEVDIVVYGR